MKKRGEAKDAVDTQALDKEFIHQCKETYEKEFSRFLKMPQLGLTRFYQERAMTAADKHNIFQGALSEFLQMLYMPMEKAFTSLQDKMAEMAEEGPLDEKSKTYYNLWVQLLEGHYMELFKQSEFIEGLSGTLEALEDYSAARQAVVDDFLKMHAIPTQNEMDELYKEIYHLKKRMRGYEKNG
jgi:class III poly(R)-hydroxyalkanoic acid synthase PhaE subunit